MVSSKKSGIQSNLEDLNNFVYGKLKKAIPLDELELVRENVSFRRVNGSLFVSCTNKIFTDAAEDIYGRRIEFIAKEMGAENVEYIDLSRQNEQMSFNSEPVLSDNEEELIRRCSRYASLNDAGFNGCEPIIHGGNRDVYGSLNYFFEQLKNGEKPESPLIIHGKNGLGKSHALEYLLLKARQEDIPAVAYDVDKFVHYLTPKEKGGAGGGMFTPEWYELAEKTAKLVVLDQSHAMVNKAKAGFDQRVGTQRRIYHLIQEISKRNGYVVLSFTDTSVLQFQGLADLLKNEVQDRWENHGHADLGDRLSNYISVEIGNVPKEDYADVVKHFLWSEVSQEIIEAFVDADYGVQSSIRRADSNVRKVMWRSKALGYKITPRLIMKTIGSAKAKEHFCDKYK